MYILNNDEPSASSQKNTYSENLSQRILQSVIIIKKAQETHFILKQKKILMQNKNLFYQDQKKFYIVSKIQQHHCLQDVNSLFSSCKQTIYNL